METIIENEIEQIEQPITGSPEEIAKRKKEIIERIESGGYTLSYSGLKEFAKSPASYIVHKLRGKEPTKAMIMGSYIHCAILEPEQLDNRYLVFDKKDLPFPESTMNKTENKLFKQGLLIQAQKENKELIDPVQWNEAQNYKDLILNNSIAKHYVNNLITKEEEVFCNISGINFRGFRDGKGNGYIMDLKKVADAHPSKIKWTAKDSKWHWQAFIYLQSKDCDEFTGYYNLAIDKISPAIYEIGFANLEQAKFEIHAMLDHWKRCIDTQAWDSGYEFFCENNKGIFSI